MMTFEMDLLDGDCGIFYIYLFYALTLCQLKYVNGKEGVTFPLHLLTERH